MPPPGATVPFSAEDADPAAYGALREAALRHGFVPVFRHGLLLEVAMIDPEDAAALGAIRQLTHQEVRRFGIGEEDFDRAVAALEARRAEPAAPTDPKAETMPSCPEAWDLHRLSAREVAAAMVRFAFEAGASDLLIDDQEAWTDVAVHLGGRKEMLPPVERARSPALFKAFKEIAGLATSAALASQSGAAGFPMPNDRRAELRLEFSPTVHGESLVARVQDRENQLRRMKRLPFDDPAQLRTVEDCLRRRQGLIVATGPTGQGKTSTLYACLGRLDRSALNIRTLEDPVEFVVPWIAQIPVGADSGRSFGQGLKSLLRQAPHVVLLGEIRDREAAQIGIEAVATGHLILTTLHTRDAIGTVARLLDLGLTGRQIGSGLLLAIGQRLARRLCPECRRPAAPTAAQARQFESHGLPVPEALHQPGGCPRCGGRGARGVVPIFECFQPSVDPALEDAIGRATLATFDESALRERWKQAGGSPLVREGLRLAAAGRIAYEEALCHERG